MCCDASGELHNVKLTNIASCNVIKYTNLPLYWILAYDSRQNPREKKKTINLKYHSTNKIYLNYLPSGTFHSTNIFSIASVHFLSGHSGTQI